MNGTRKKGWQRAGRGANSNMRHPAYASPVCLLEVSRLYKTDDDLMATGQ